MKRWLPVLVMIALLAPALAHAGPVPAKSELVIAGSYFKAKDSDAVWNVDSALGAAVGNRGGILLGPKVRLSSDDTKTALGGIFAINFLGSSHSGPYVAISGLYNLKEVEGVVRYTGDLEAGFKLQVASDCSKACGGINISASQTMYGRGKDGARPGGFLGTFIRF